MKLSRVFLLRVGILAMLISTSLFVIVACDRSPPQPPPNTTDPCKLSYSGPAPTTAQCQNCANQVGCMACCGRLAAPPAGGCRNWCGSSAAIDSNSRYAMLGDIILDPSPARQYLSMWQDSSGGQNDAQFIQVQVPPYQVRPNSIEHAPSSALRVCREDLTAHTDPSDDGVWPTTADVLAVVPDPLIQTVTANGWSSDFTAYINGLHSWGRESLIWELWYINDSEWDTVNGKLGLALPTLSSYLNYWASDPAWSALQLRPSRCRSDRFKIFDAMFDWWLDSPELRDWILLQ